MLTYSLSEKNEYSRVLLGVIVLFLLASPVLAQENGTSRQVYRVGDSFTISRPVRSTFYHWELQDYDPRKLALTRERKPDTIGSYSFQFEALEPGEVQITLRKVVRTQLGERTTKTERIPVVIRREDRFPTPPETPYPPAYKPTADTAIQPQKQTQPKVDQNLWARASELIKVGRFEEAREIITNQKDQSGGDVRRKWHEKLARSYVKEGEFDTAVQEYRNLIESYPDGPIPKWFLQIAKAYRKMGNDREAELVLLKIRHRYSNAKQWPEAMEMLADIAIENNQINRARNILEKARSFYKGREKPRLTLRLARLYDQYPPIRDYERAVKLYQRAARRLQDKDPKAAKKARKRAEHLLKNYVEFGMNTNE